VSSPIRRAEWIDRAAKHGTRAAFSRKENPYALNFFSRVARRLRCPDQVYLGFALLRLLIVLLLIVGFPPLESHDGWYFHHGGDQNYYFDYGDVLARGTFARYFSVNLGMPALMALAIRVTGASTFSALLPLVVLLNGFLLGGLSVLVVGRLAARLTRHERCGYLAGGLWALMPWLLWLLFWPHPRADWLRMPYVPGVAWLQGGPDGPGVFFALLGAYFLALSMDSNQLRWPLLSGVAFGVMLLFRAHFAALLLLGVLVLGLKRRGWHVALLLIAAATLYLPQVLYNRLASLELGTPGYIPWLPGYLYFGVLDVMAETVYYADNTAMNVIAFDYLLDAARRLLWRETLMAVAAALVGCLAVWGFHRAGRSLGWDRAVLLFGAAPAAIGVLSLSPIFAENVYRFSLPAVPFLAVLVSWAWVVLTSGRANASK